MPPIIYVIKHLYTYGIRITYVYGFVLLIILLLLECAIRVSHFIPGKTYKKLIC